MSGSRRDKPTPARWPEPAQDEIAHLLGLLRSDASGAVTIAAMHAHGIRAPAQAIYALQLAGHQIDRVYDEHPDGLRTPAYRLREGTEAARAVEQVGPDEELRRDEQARPGEETPDDERAGAAPLHGVTPRV